MVLMVTLIILMPIMLLGALSGALKAHKLVMLTNVEGIYLNQDTATHVSQLTVKEIKHYLNKVLLTAA